MAPYSPRLITSACGPLARIFPAARRRLCSSAGMRASLSLMGRKSHPLMVASHADGSDRREEDGGKRNVGAGAAQHALDVSVRRFHAVVSYGTNYYKGHRLDCSVAECGCAGVVGTASERRTGKNACATRN